MKPKMKIIGLISLFILGYFIVRERNVEIWRRDGQPYVIYPENKILYYIYRPFSYLDAQITGMKFHIGPHKEE